MLRIIEGPNKDVSFNFKKFFFVDLPQWEVIFLITIYDLYFFLYQPCFISQVVGV